VTIIYLFAVGLRLPRNVRMGVQNGPGKTFLPPMAFCCFRVSSGPSGGLRTVLGWERRERNFRCCGFCAI
jgi:hypothetical protein